MRTEMAGIRQEMTTKSDTADIRSEMRSLRADVAADLIAMEARQDDKHRQTQQQVAGLRRAVMEYHTSVIGRGILVSELEARVRRVEQHLELPSMEAHRGSCRLGPFGDRPSAAGGPRRT